jgi:hypothetical protein
MLNIGNFLFADLPATTTNTSLTTQPLTGKFGVGTSSPYAKLTVWGQGTGTGQAFEIVNNASTTLARFLDNGTGYFLGNIGIGTTSPSEALEIGNSTGGGVAAVVTNSNSGTSAFAEVAARNGYTALDSMRMLALGTGFSASGAFISDAGVLDADSNLSNGLSIVARGTSAPMRFYTGGEADANERFRVTSAGNVGIGTTSPYAKLTVWGQGAGTGQAFEIVNNASTTLARFLDDGTGYFLGNIGIGTTTPWRTLSVSGTVAMNGLTTSATGNALCITAGKEITDAGAAACVPSSERFKENIETLAQGFALDELAKLRTVSFDYKDGMYSPEDLKGSYGMIAEEVEKIDPKLVDYGYDGKPLTLKFEKFTGLLVQAAQELYDNFQKLVARVTGLEEKLNTQQTEIDNLKNRVNALDGQTAPAPVALPPPAAPLPMAEPEPATTTVAPAPVALPPPAAPLPMAEPEPATTTVAPAPTIEPATTP